MVSLFGRGFESHQLHPNKSESPVVRLNYRTFAFYYIMYQCLHNCGSYNIVVFLTIYISYTNNCFTL